MEVVECILILRLQEECNSGTLLIEGLLQDQVLLLKHGDYVRLRHGFSASATRKRVWVLDNTKKDA
jgi:hypothetical protein